MSYLSRLNKAYQGALTLPLLKSSKYVILSDCHRGNGTTNDNFLKNKTLYLAALRHYYNYGFTYLELGDGDELWENRRIEQIMEIHSDIFHLLECFYMQNRLYMLYGNHDIIKKRRSYSSRHYRHYPNYCYNNPHLTNKSLMPNLRFYEGILLRPTHATWASGSSASHMSLPEKTEIFLTHGHQADLRNSTLWPLSRFLVRHLWKPLERLGIADPTSAGKNYTRSTKKTEKRLEKFAKQKGILQIAGHTHRPYLSEENLHYCNSGCCIHPYSITCLEIENLQISLVKWQLNTDSNNHLYVKREILSGPFPCP